MLAAVPLLLAAFTVGRPEPLPPPALPPPFDQTTAVAFTSELANRFPDRSPGSAGARGAANWVARQFAAYRLDVERRAFSAEIPGRGRVQLETVLGVARRTRPAGGRSSQAIVVLAHRDNLGISPGANDNASGTGALLELARNAGTASLGHPLVFASTDGGAYGGLGAADLARDPDALKQLIGPGAGVIAVLNLDAIAGAGPPRLVFAGQTARGPAATLVATADASILAQTGRAPVRAAPLGQLADLAFPFTLHEQGPFIAHGVPAVTLTTGGERPRGPVGDRPETLAHDRLGDLGRSAQALLTSLDEGADAARGTESYVYVGSRSVGGWTIQFLLLVALIPALAATIDLFARSRRRHVRLWPSVRSLVSRLGVWLWAGGVFAVFALVGLFPDGDAPVNPESAVAQEWAVAPLLALAALAAAGWFVAYPRLAAREPASREDELAGHLAAMLALGVVALLVAASNPFALLLLLPSLHAWLWLANVRGTARAPRVVLFALGLAGPFLLVASFATRYELGLDAPWYLVTLAAIGYVPLPLLVAGLVWGAAATQMGAVVFGRYAPYPDADVRPARGPIREAIRRGILFARGRRRAAAAEPEAEIRSLER